MWFDSSMVCFLWVCLIMILWNVVFIKGLSFDVGSSSISSSMLVVRVVISVIFWWLFLE